MVSRGLCVATACAAVVNALLLPPDFTRPGHKIGLLDVDPKLRSVRLPCPACAFPPDSGEVEASADHDTWVWGPGGSNDVVLNFSISDDGRYLLLNNESIYPHIFRGYLASAHPIFVKPASVSSGLVKPLEITGSSLRIDQEHPASDEGDVVVPIHYQILTLDTQQMKGLPEVSIDLLKTVEGELFILEAESFSPPRPFDFHEEHHHAGECRLWPAFLCTLKDFIDEKWDALRHEKPAWQEDEVLPPFYEEGAMEFPTPHHNKHHHQHTDDDMPHEHHRHHHHHILHNIIRGLIGALIPILAGITVGLTVSFIALTIGRAVAWSLYRISGRSSRRDRNGIDAADLAEGKLLMADDEVDIPPAYENAPAYDDVA